MRKKEKEVRDKNTIESVMKRATICRIGLSENDVPYVVPLNFGYKDNCLYFHSAKEGKKIDMMRKNNTVCFEIDVDNELVRAENPCKWSMKYYSVIGFGKAFFLEDSREKRQALNIIMEHYAGKSSFEYPEMALDSVAVIKVEIDSITGKRSGWR
jgi:nitroimidazol reductase NimA-like FMN-containing flavoprotein (pyridoxamine 5'-phosphate oxidase superfamily)